MLFSDFVHGFGVTDTKDHDLMFDLLTDSKSLFLWDGYGSGFVEHVVGNIGQAETAG